MRRTRRHIARRDLLGGSRRRFDYDRRLLPNPQVAALEPAEVSGRDKLTDATSWSLGYPAWNLLYYALYTSILPERDDVVVLETGTNRGVSTIVIAQALKDLGGDAVLDTVEHDPELVEAARENLKRAGLEDRARFHTGDAIEFLGEMAERFDHFDFVLIDDLHTYDQVWQEIEIVQPMVAACWRQDLLRQHRLRGRGPGDPEAAQAVRRQPGDVRQLLLRAAGQRDLAAGGRGRGRRGRVRPAGYKPSCLPMISFMISSVPPPIGPRRASRSARSTSYSRM